MIAAMRLDMIAGLGAEHIHLSALGSVGVWPKRLGYAPHIDAQHGRNLVPVMSFGFEQARGFHLIFVEVCAVNGDFIHCYPCDGVDQDSHFYIHHGWDGYARQGGSDPLPQPSIAEVFLAVPDIDSCQAGCSNV